MYGRTSRYVTVTYFSSFASAYCFNLVGFLLFSNCVRITSSVVAAMATIARLFLKSLLKAINKILGMVGIVMILYGLWMVRVWERD
jgi:hypothetical protein